MQRSASETVDGSALPLESIDDVHGGDGFSSGVLSVGDGISDDSLEEALEDLPGVVVDERRDSLDTSSSGEPPDSRLGDAFNGSLGALSLVDSLGSNLSLSSDTLSTFSLSGHCTLINYYEKPLIIKFKLPKIPNRKK